MPTLQDIIMKIITTKKELRETLTQARSITKRIAFVPTMGALHAGHLSLIAEARRVADVVICSIFVNPTQFNDKNDLRNYPKPLEKDVALLEEQACDYLFLPEAEEMYPPEGTDWHFDLGRLGTLWEAAQRPGHFDGVTEIVYKLFDAVKPDIALFGQKDLQQFKVVEYMVNALQIPIELVMCPILREKEGLAMSSRNARLSKEGKKHALAIANTLKFAVENPENLELLELKSACERKLMHSPGVHLAYFAFCDLDSLEEINHFKPKQQVAILVAATVEGVRLLDNALLS